MSCGWACRCWPARMTLEPGWRRVGTVSPVGNGELYGPPCRRGLLRGWPSSTRGRHRGRSVRQGVGSPRHPGHDAWVVGEQRFVGLSSSQSAKQYAKGWSRPAAGCRTGRSEPTARARTRCRVAVQLRRSDRSARRVVARVVPGSWLSRASVPRRSVVPNVTASSGRCSLRVVPVPAARRASSDQLARLPKTE